MVAAYNVSHWPAAVLAYVLALSVTVVLLRRKGEEQGRRSGRVIGALLVVAWVWNGVFFHFGTFASINFLAPLYGSLFVLQSLLFAIAAIIRGRFVTGWSEDVFAWCGLGLIVYAMVAYPVFSLLWRDSLNSTTVVGVAPSPTALFTLGVLLLGAGRACLHLSVLPVAWLFVAGFTAWEIGRTEDMPLPLLGVGAIVLLVWKNRSSDDRNRGQDRTLPARHLKTADTPPKCSSKNP